MYPFAQDLSAPGELVKIVSFDIDLQFQCKLVDVLLNPGTRIANVIHLVDTLNRNKSYWHWV